MQSILRSVFADRTLIAIAHRLDTILDFDRVVVMDSGQIVEIGEPGVLMKVEGSMERREIVRMSELKELSLICINLQEKLWWD